MSGSVSAADAARVVVQTPKEIPAWLADMDFCCIYISDTDERNLCGSPITGKGSHATEYDGEAICSECGKPTCPRCAQLSALEDAFEVAGEGAES